jgi:hypothetical protein
MNGNAMSMLFAACVASGAFAAGEQQTVSPFRLNLSEQYGYYNYTGTKSSLNEFNTVLEFDFQNSLLARVELPVYSQGSETNIGDVTVMAEYVLMRGAMDKWSVRVNAGVDVPTETEFSSTNVNPFIGAGFFMHLTDEFTFNQSVEYTFVGGNAYVPYIGEFTNSDILNLESTLSWFMCKNLKVSGLFVQQYYVDASEYQLFLGPSVSYQVNHFLDLNCGALFPISQSVSGGNTDFVITAGVGFTF